MRSFFRVSESEPHSATSASKVVDVGKVAGRNDGLVESVNCHVTKRTATKRASGTAGESKQRLLSELNTSPTSLIFFPLSGPALGRENSVYLYYLRRDWNPRTVGQASHLFFDHRKAKQVCEPVPRKSLLDAPKPNRRKRMRSFGTASK